LFEQILPTKKPRSAETLSLLAQLTAVIGARNQADEIRLVLDRIAATELNRTVQRDLVAALGDGLLRAGRTLRALDLPADSAPRRLISDLLNDAARTAASERAPTQERIQAMQLLAHAEFDKARGAIRAALDPRQPQALQLAAIRALRTEGDPGVPALLLERWTAYTPSVRGEAIAALSGRVPWALALLDAVATKRVPLAHVDSTRRTILMKHRDPKVRARAEELLGPAAASSRKEVIERYLSAVKSGGNAAKGREVYRRDCASCHIAGNLGQIVGPAMASVGTKTPEALLTAILDPNREIDPRYLNYTVALTDGRVTSGIISAESATTITLRRQDAINETVLRSQIEELRSTGQSLMPEEFEKKITPEEMRDLIAFLMES
jgi:putative heme-binding domain-containing protein